MAINGYISDGTAFFDANRDELDFQDVNGNGVADPGEQFEPAAYTAADGWFKLPVPLAYDTNGNGQLDPDEGQLVVLGGTVTSTDLPLITALSAPVGSTVVTPSPPCCWRSPRDGAEPN